jgi:hypothetical protein
MPLKPYSKAPFDQAVGQQTQEWMDWVTNAVNQLSGQGQAPSGQGFQSLQQRTIDPTTATIVSAGSRTSSVTTAIAFTFTATTATFYWDGTNGSQVLRIGRDDGTVVGPTKTGSPFTVTGLGSNQYFFYAYWDEAQQKVVFASNSAAVGTPAVAFLSPNFQAAQQQIMRGHIPLGILLVTIGVTLTGSSGSGTGGSGGGGAGAGGNRGALQG